MIQLLPVQMEHLRVQINFAVQPPFYVVESMDAETIVTRTNVKCAVSVTIQSLNASFMTTFIHLDCEKP